MSHQIVCTGLVLRAWSGTLSILSPEEGRVERKWYPTAHRFQMQCGSLISYSKQRKFGRESSVLEGVEVDLCATGLASQDIYLLHYLLEVCYYFIPLGSEAQHSFYFLTELFKNFHIFITPFQKKSVLCKLFALLGICPDDQQVQVLAYELRQMPIDNLVDGVLQLTTEELMNQWLAWCMEIHPKGKFFKAMPLLLEK